MRPDVPANSRRVLVVDDNADAAEMLGILLDSAGYETRTALDGASALRIADEFHPDIAVLDIGLPGMDGYAVAEQMRAQPSTSSVRLIAVTGYGRDSDRERAKHAGFDEHVTKPVSISTLISLLAR